MAKQINDRRFYKKGSLDMCILKHCFGKVIYGFDTIIVMNAVPVILTDSLYKSTLAIKQLL